MRLKLQNSFIILFIIIGLAFYGCVDEPNIDPVKRPYTSVRVANFSNNQATLNVSVDGEFIQNVDQNALTTYFDLNSGSREYVLRDANGNEIFNKPITMVSYEEVTLVFSGYLSTVDTLNTFGFQTCNLFLHAVENGLRESDLTQAIFELHQGACFFWFFFI